MPNSITEFTKQRPKEPGRYLMREGFDTYYMVLQRSEQGFLYVVDGSAGAASAFAYHLAKPTFAKIELSE